MQLSIILVSFNARGDLERCLESLHAPLPSASHEIIVVDNHSSDGSAEAARRWPDVRVIDAGANLGFAAANNIGIRASQGAALLLLNSDTIVPPYNVDGLLKELGEHPDAAVVGPRLVDADRRVELSFGRMLGPFNELRQKILVRGHARRHSILSLLVERATHRYHWTDWVSGACLLVHRDAAERAGLFDERYFIYAEDVDFCAAIRANGGKILFTPKIEIVHVRGRSRAAVPIETERAYRRSQVAFYEKHHPAWAPVLKLYLRLRGRL